MKCMNLQKVGVRKLILQSKFVSWLQRELYYDTLNEQAITFKMLQWG